MAVAFQAAGTDVATTTTTLALVAPTTAIDDIIVANIYSANNTAVTPPQGWTAIQQFNNTVAMRQDTFWYRAAAGDSGATFNFTVAGTTLSYGVLTTYRGAVVSINPIRASSQSANIVADAVTYATITPKDANSLIVALGTYALNATTAGAMSGTNPTFTNRVDAETATSSTASLFGYDGLSTNGSATGSRSHATTSTVDALNSGVLFELLAPEDIDDVGGGRLNAGSAPTYPAVIRTRADNRAADAPKPY